MRGKLVALAGVLLVVLIMPTLTHVNVVKALAHGDALGLLDCTAILQGGRIMFYGSVRFSQTGQGVTFAVIGGTQSFRNAQGVVLAKDGKFKGDKGTFLTFKL